MRRSVEACGAAKWGLTVDAEGSDCGDVGVVGGESSEDRHLQCKCASCKRQSETQAEVEPTRRRSRLADPRWAAESYAHAPACPPTTCTSLWISVK